jgi:hypothetical protein
MISDSFIGTCAIFSPNVSYLMMYENKNFHIHDGQQWFNGYKNFKFVPLILLEIYIEMLSHIFSI